MIWALLFIGFSILMTVPVPPKKAYQSLGIDDIMSFLVLLGFAGTLIMTLIEVI